MDLRLKKLEKKGLLNGNDMVGKFNQITSKDEANKVFVALDGKKFSIRSACDNWNEILINRALDKAMPLDGFNADHIKKINKIIASAKFKGDNNMNDERTLYVMMDNFAQRVWKRDEYDEYEINGGLFVVIKGTQWVAAYPLSCIRGFEVR